MQVFKFLSFFVHVVFILLIICHTKECSGTNGSSIKCRKKIDLGILIDASASMGEENFKAAKDFAKRLLSRFRITPSKTRVSLNYFSAYHHIVTKFSDDLVTDELKLLVDNMKLEKSFSYLSKAIMGLRWNVYPRVFGSRARTKGETQVDIHRNVGTRPRLHGSKMVAVFLTDAFDSYGSEELEFYANDIRKFGVKTYAVGVLGENSTEGMLALAGKPARKHQFHMYKNKHRMEEEIDKLVAEICK